ncbi:hypothetical protein D3C71_1286650 [compost metagenome]
MYSSETAWIFVAFDHQPEIETWQMDLMRERHRAIEGGRLFCLQILPYPLNRHWSSRLSTTTFRF